LSLTVFGGDSFVILSPYPFIRQPYRSWFFDVAAVTHFVPQHRTGDKE
jgi:hypothetical protein